RQPRTHRLKLSNLLLIASERELRSHLAIHRGPMGQMSLDMLCTALVCSTAAVLPSREMDDWENSAIKTPIRAQWHRSCRHWDQTAAEIRSDPAGSRHDPERVGTPYPE